MLNIDSIKKVKNFSIRDYVYEILRENIISLKMDNDLIEDLMPIK